MSTPQPDCLAHHAGDYVAVAVKDLEPGRVKGAYLDTEAPIDVQLSAPVPLGHKLALRDIPEDGDVIEYGLRIGIASKPISAGDYVHVHNVRSARWHNSIA